MQWMVSRFKWLQIDGALQKNLICYNYLILLRIELGTLWKLEIFAQSIHTVKATCRGSRHF